LKVKIKSCDEKYLNIIVCQKYLMNQNIKNKIFMKMKNLFNLKIKCIETLIFNINVCNIYPIQISLSFGKNK
jgi:hypothetical protein